MTVLSNSDALLVAVPMIGLLVACHFRLDELVGKPRNPRKSLGRKLVGMQAGGSLDPGQDGRLDPQQESHQSQEAARRFKLPEVRRPRVRIEVE